MLLENKNAVIYGAGGDLGGVIARAFAREGARVFITGRTLAPLSALAEEITRAGGKAEAAQVDGFDAQAIEKHLAEVVRKAGSIDISFNLVGIGYEQGDPLTKLALENFVPQITEAMTTQFLTTTAAGRHMSKQGSGVILAITATPGRKFVLESGSFGVACAAIEGLCRQLAGELGPQGVRVICLRSAGSPDLPKLDMVFGQLAELYGVSREQFEANLAERTLLKRLPRGAEVANMAVLMASDYASALTGTVANVNCGEITD